MSKKATLFVTLLIISVIHSVFIATVQASGSQLIAISDNELTFYGNEGVTDINRVIKIVGISDTEVTVELFFVYLYDNSSGNFIVFDEATLNLQPFNLARNEEKSLTIVLDTSQASAGTYYGSIIVTATTPANITVTTIEVEAQIEQGALLFSGTYWVILVIALIIITLLVRLTLDKEWVVIILGISTVGVWVYTMILISSLGDLRSIVSTILIGPFAAYVITYAKDKRTEKVEKEKASRKTHVEGINKDIELLRDLIGELASHFASFRPNLYEEKNCLNASRLETSYRVLYNKSGLLSKKVWEDSRRQGMVSDLPMLELEKYYDFIDIYNKYYTCAMKITANENKEKKALCEPKACYLRLFEDFRAKYAELETVLFIHLTYYLGLFSSTCLSPLKADYPRVTRTLLKRLIKYKVLIAKDYGLSTEDLEEKIEKWEMSAHDLNKISKKIYHKDSQPKFYREVEDEFQEKYVQLKISVEDLLPLPEACKEEASKEVKLGLKGSLALDLDKEDNKD
ncbi:MAG: hypothetical protein NWF06_01790 [Candidatus Bathyarchaeota archaeon]|nr:hypothetical protein [Candidatus Bathyarchaeum sp.]